MKQTPKIYEQLVNVKQTNTLDDLKRNKLYNFLLPSTKLLYCLEIYMTKNSDSIFFIFKWFLATTHSSKVFIHSPVLPVMVSSAPPSPALMISHVPSPSHIGTIGLDIFFLIGIS